MNLEMIILSEVNQTRETNIIWLICGTLKSDTNDCIYETETDSQTKQIYGYERGKVADKDRLGVWG